MDDSLTNEAQEGKLDTSRASTSGESPRPKVASALQIDLGNKENDKGDCKPSTPKTEQNKDVTKKPQTPTESTHHTLRAPYAQPVLDASKLNEAKKSSVEERLASAKERRIQQQRHLVLGWDEDGSERGLKLKLEKEDQAHAKWKQSVEDKRRKVDENRAKEDQHRKEVEMRKKQQIEEDKKRAEAKVARTDQVYEVTMRQKRSTSTDRVKKRWSWGGAAGGGGGGGGSGDSTGTSPFHYFDPTRMTKRTPSTGKEWRPVSMHASHFDISQLGRLSKEGDDLKFSSQTNLTSPSVTKQSSDKFSKSPLLVNSPHMAFASGLRSYDCGAGKGHSPDSPRQRSSSIGTRPRNTGTGRPVRAASMEHIPVQKEQPAPTMQPAPSSKTPVMRGRSPMPKVTMTTTAKIREQLSRNQKTTSGRLTSSGLTEPVSISPRLLAPTKSSLARSRNAINDLDDTASQSSNDSKSHGPMRSRSKDRRSAPAARSNIAGTSPRVDPSKGGASKQTPERKSTPTRGTSPVVPNRRAPSPSTLTAPTASSGAKRSTSVEMNKPKRGNSPKPRPLRAPSPASRPRLSDTSHTTPTRTSPKKRQPSPSPVASRTKYKTQNDSPKLASTPPNIKPSLRPTPSNQIKPKTSSSTKPVSSKTSKVAATKAKQDTLKQTQKQEKLTGQKQKLSEKSAEPEDSGFQDAAKPGEENLPTSNSGVTLSTSGMISKSASDTSQGVSDILTSDNEQRDVKPRESSQDDQTAKTDKPAMDESENSQSKEKTAEPAKIIEPPVSNDSASIKQVNQPEQPEPESPQIVEQISTIKTESEVMEKQEICPAEPSPTEAPKIGENDPSSDEIHDKITLAAESGFHLNEEEAQDVGDVLEENHDSLTSFHTVEPVDLRAMSPTDSLEEVDETASPQPASPQPASPQPDSFDEESEEEQLSVKENVPEEKESAEVDERLVETAAEESNDSAISDKKQQEEGAKEGASETVQKEEEESMEKGITPDAVDETSDAPTSDATKTQETSNQPALVEPQRPSDATNFEETNNQTTLVELQQPSAATKIEESSSQPGLVESQRSSDATNFEETNNQPGLVEPQRPSDATNFEETSNQPGLVEPQRPSDATNFEETNNQPGLVEPQQPSDATKLEETSNQPSLVEPQQTSDATKIEETNNQTILAEPQQTSDVTNIEETNNQPGLVEPQQPSDATKMEETSNQTTLVVPQQTSDGEVPNGVAIKTPDQLVKDELQENGGRETSQTNAEGTQSAERKSQPRKNLATDEDKEAYRQAIAEKRRELKEKKEQEERERQERIALSKLEQAKREEEARRMFEEAAASAEMEKKLEEERARERQVEEQKRQEEEKKKEEEANERKREAAEKVRREREMQKQKQEDERMARKKRLEMIMRRTRHPDATGDSSKLKTDESASPLGTPSPQQSPASGRSPSTQSPVGGKSPLSAVTPERSISPAVAAILNKSSESLSALRTSDKPQETSMNSSISEPNLLNFTNSASKHDSSGVELIKIDSEKLSAPTNIERPVPFEAFTEKNIFNGVEESSQNHNGSNNTGPPSLLSNGPQNPQQASVPVNGSQDLLLDFDSDALQRNEPLVSTEI